MVTTSETTRQPRPMMKMIEGQNEPVVRNKKTREIIAFRGDNTVGY